jgi:DNA-binding NtrC family response regulator
MPAQYFFVLAAAEGLPLKRIESDALERLKRYRWPGNIRELENLTRRLAALYPQEAVTAPSIPESSVRETLPFHVWSTRAPLIVGSESLTKKGTTRSFKRSAAQGYDLRLAQDQAFRNLGFQRLESSSVSS